MPSSIWFCALHGVMVINMVTVATVLHHSVQFIDFVLSLDMAFNSCIIYVYNYNKRCSHEYTNDKEDMEEERKGCFEL